MVHPSSIPLVLMISPVPTVGYIVAIVWNDTKKLWRDMGRWATVAPFPGCPSIRRVHASSSPFETRPCCSPSSPSPTNRCLQSIRWRSFVCRTVLGHRRASPGPVAAATVRPSGSPGQPASSGRSPWSLAQVTVDRCRVHVDRQPWHMPARRRRFVRHRLLLASACRAAISRAIPSLLPREAHRSSFHPVAFETGRRFEKKTM